MIKILTDWECRECEGYCYWDGIHEGDEFYLTCSKCGQGYRIPDATFTFKIIVVCKE